MYQFELGKTVDRADMDDIDAAHFRVNEEWRLAGIRKQKRARLLSRVKRGSPLAGGILFLGAVLGVCINSEVREELPAAPTTQPATMSPDRQRALLAQDAARDHSMAHMFARSYIEPVDAGQPPRSQLGSFCLMASPYDTESDYVQPPVIRQVPGQPDALEVTPHDTNARAIRLNGLLRNDGFMTPDDQATLDVLASYHCSPLPDRP